MIGDDKIHAKTKRRRSSHGLVEWLLIAIVFLYAGLLLIGPLVAIVQGSLAAGFGNLWTALTAPDSIHALKLTLALSVGATTINAIFGTCIAWVLVRDKFIGRRFLNGLVDLPFAVSPVIAGLMLVLLFGRGGWFTSATEAAGIKILFAWPAMLLATTFVSLPFVIREVMPVLLQAGMRQEYAAYTMGANGPQTFWHVTLPSIRWGLLYGVSLTFARSIGEFGALLVVGGGVIGSTETSTLLIYRSLDDRNYTQASAVALELAVLSFTVLMLMEIFKGKRKRS
ncbi:MAG TPA: sulfate ABC transporter permease subunit [Acidobacteriota bacterium]|jgi:sulfate transport system permease protein|nr:sulfate ABC transporter permease subunit [Acidobacteriota bacterium]